MTSLQFKYRLAVLLILVATVVATTTVFAKPPLQGPNDPSFDPLGEFEAVEEEESIERVETAGPDSRQQEETKVNNLIDRIPIQGVLQNGAGQPLANQSNLAVTFRLYEAVDADPADDKANVCKSVATVQTDANGYFNSFIAGCATEIKDSRLLDGQQVYLGIQVGTDAEMTPRRPLYPVPYAVTLMPGASIRGTVNNQLGTLYVTNNAKSFRKGNTVYFRGAIRGYSTSGVNYGYGVYGRTNNPQGFGVYGRADQDDSRGVYGFTPGYVFEKNDKGQTIKKLLRGGSGLFGRSDSIDNGYGVFAVAVNKTGTNYGVFGRSDSNAGHGVYGVATSISGTVTYGVYGQARSSRGYGIHGLASSKDGTNYGVHGQADGDTGYGVSGVATSISGTVTYGVYGQAASNKGYGVYGTAVVTGVTGVVTSPVGSTYGVHGVSYSNSGHGVYGQSTNTGVGVMARSSGGRPVEAYGSVADKPVFYVENQGDVHTIGSYHCGKTITETLTALSTDGTTLSSINRQGLAPCLQDSNEADFAEMLPVSDTALEAGDVLAVNEAGQLVRTQEAYQATVVGVYSTKPSYLGNSQMYGNDAYAPLALMGIVPVKATTENGVIRPGDLLVSSSTPGHAMRAGDDAPNGMTIGKALASLSDDTGLIRMLVMLR